VVAAWGRVRGSVQILPFGSIAVADRERIEAEAEELPIPGVTAIEVHWRDDP